MSDCFICTKNKSLTEFTGEVIMERSGLVLTHFPDVKNERATRGHLLIDTRRHITQLEDLTDSESEALGFIVKRAVHAIKSQLGAEHVYFFRINDLVTHVHFHLVPRYPGTPREFWGHRITEFPNRDKIDLETIRATSSHLKAKINC